MKCLIQKESPHENKIKEGMDKMWGEEKNKVIKQRNRRKERKKSRNNQRKEKLSKIIRKEWKKRKRMRLSYKQF